MIEAILLGTAQDGGIPHAGCRCSSCDRAWDDPSFRRRVCSLALLDRSESRWYLIDATPDLPEQLHLMRQIAPTATLAGVILTHAHMGHYAGLLQFGREALAATGLELHATARVLAFLAANAPWSGLLQEGRLLPRELVPGRRVALGGRLGVEAVEVPHRAEYSDTIAVVATGERRSLMYMPDIDRWDGLEPPIEELLERVDISLIDGTFFDADELPSHAMASVPHPFLRDTANRLAGAEGDVRFIHFNHTNPVIYDPELQRWVQARGLQIARELDRWEL